METLEKTLKRLSREGELYERRPDGSLHCFACAHDCKIREGRAGVCRVRYNQGGKLYVPFNYVGALQIDPIEKKPFFHALPGARALSFGMLGCDYHCFFCQNWVTSQALRDPAADTPPRECTPRDLVRMAKESAAAVITSTYNEPLITGEWAVAVFKEAREAGLRCSFVSNGNATPRALRYLRPWIDFYKVDLKGFDDKRYRQIMGGVLANVLRTIEDLVSLGLWIEIVTLIIPGVNDSDEELRGIAKFLAGVSKDIPWHVTAFHKDYKMTDPENTPTKTLLRAAEIAAAEGLRYIYAGNVPGQVGDWENTTCPSCRTCLIERYGFKVLANRIKKGKCPECHTPIPGIWA